MHMCCKIAKFDVMFFIKCTLYNFLYYTKTYFWRYLSADTYQVVYSFLFHTSFFICNPSQDSRAPKICDPHIIWKPFVTKIMINCKKGPFFLNYTRMKCCEPHDLGEWIIYLQLTIVNQIFHIGRGLS